VFFAGLPRFLTGLGASVFSFCGNDFILGEPTLLTASLDIHADGTYTFDMEPPEY
jgi:hypothetical protein